MRLAEETYATLHKQLGCSRREVVTEEDFGGEVDYVCTGCGPNKKADEKIPRCVFPECNKGTHFITLDA